MDSKLSNTINQLCQRLANLEKKVNKGIVVEDGNNSSEILNLGDTLRFNSNNGLSTTISPGSVNVTHDTLNIAHCTDSYFNSPICGVQGDPPDPANTLGMPEPETLLSFGQGDGIWFNQQLLTMWLFLWFDNGEITNQDQINAALSDLDEFSMYVDSDGNVDTTKVKVYVGHYDVFLVNDNSSSGSGIKPGPIFPIIRIESPTLNKNYVDAYSLFLNEKLNKRNNDLSFLGVSDANKFWNVYFDRTVETGTNTQLFFDMVCSQSAPIYDQDPSDCAP
jgi:hypothetical protein